MRHGPPARDGIPPLHSDVEALPEETCLSCVTSDDGDTPAELGHKLLTMHPQAPSDSKASGTKRVRDGDLRILCRFRHFRLCRC